ncbi:MAG: AI-2E family transporter [Gemmatimonadota bacterium]
MAILASPRQRAAAIILILGIALLIALMPFATGLIGGLALYVVLLPFHALLRKRLGSRVAGSVVVAVALLLLVVPIVSFAGLLVAQAQEIAGGILRSPLLGRLATLKVGRFDVGPQIAQAGQEVVTWIGSSALGLIGTATRVGLNLTIALFVLFYLLTSPANTWSTVKPFFPFSDENAEALRTRFRDVTVSTIIGTGLVALIQGTLVALGFWATGLSNALFWGAVTVVLSILPVVGSALVWGPGTASLASDGHYVAALLLAAGGVLVVGNVDLVIRPLIFRRYAQIHPLVTLIGAVAGVGYFGLLGILIGPLALQYFFELIRMYGEEYVRKPSL